MTKSFRDLHPGMGQAVAERTILRKKENGKWETWGDVAKRVGFGNVSLLPRTKNKKENLENLTECINLMQHIAHARILMSGRHLQHGDSNQKNREMEIFTNCSTAALSSLSFYFLLNGSGVGRNYSNDFMLVDWTKAPTIICCLDENHPDWVEGIITPKEAQKITTIEHYHYFIVPDSREGWAEALDLWESMAYEKNKKIYLILDFSGVREKGKPIKGMQNRPASGPIPTIEAFEKSNLIRTKGYTNWETTMRIDHYFAECVVVGGARRSARIAVKYWKDPDIFRFIEIKNEANSMWSANNSVGLDEDFWAELAAGTEHAVKVFNRIAEHSYFDRKGEPGIINIDKMVENNKAIETIDKLGSSKYTPSETSQTIFKEIVDISKKKSYHHIVNPCSEITLASYGGFCVVGDFVPYHCDTVEQIKESAKALTRALIRVNLMDSIYNQEVKRTNRIGVGLTGVFEFAWKFFGIGFYDLIWPSKTFKENTYKGITIQSEKAQAFWDFIELLREEVEAEAITYSAFLGMEAPHTVLTIKPAGTTSKLFGLTEGWHLPAYEYYLRWVQFRKEDPLVAKYKANGYPVKELQTYKGTVVVGFPTQTELAKLNLGEKLVLASQATPAEQYHWLMLGEKYWLGDKVGNQISYTLKYDPNKVAFWRFKSMLRRWQKKVRCCSVMPQEDISAYEYTPEEYITKEQYEKLLANIKEVMVEDIGKEHVDCGAGGCPIDFSEGEK